MNNRSQITKPHLFNQDNQVTVYERNNPDDKFYGRIYRIVNIKTNAYVKSSPYVDHFYISFDQSVYHSILKRGWNVIYNGRVAIIGNIIRNDDDKITELFIQYNSNPYVEMPIHLEYINAILIWRDGFVIE
uniref:Uncharacterized protein n=1 Tax=viral metagenome TaxID=1070528 RepID=A0A6C0DQA1_9ZZZZ